MKRILTLILMLLPLLAAAQGELYGRYAQRSDLTVAQVTGFRLNDTVRVDVVMLVADDEAAWRRLTEEYGIGDAEGVTSWLGDAKEPRQRTRWSGKPVCRVVASPARRTMAFYRLDNERQYDALLDYQTKAMTSHKGKKK